MIGTFGSFAASPLPRVTSLTAGWVHEQPAPRRGWVPPRCSWVTASSEPGKDPAHVAERPRAPADRAGDLGPAGAGGVGDRELDHPPTGAAGPQHHLEG